MATCPSDVRAVTGSGLTDAEIQPFITTASAILELISEKTATLSTTVVNSAHTYLAAHLLTTSPVGDDGKQVRRESIEAKYSVEYLTPFNLGQGILSTQYGQTANMLLGGCLAELDKTPVSFNTIGSIE